MSDTPDLGLPMSDIIITKAELKTIAERALQLALSQDVFPWHKAAVLRNRCIKRAVTLGRAEEKEKCFAHFYGMTVEDARKKIAEMRKKTRHAN